jgi:tripartite-type tricarboxylate transporter receptor subunit TctC
MRRFIVGIAIGLMGIVPLAQAQAQGAYPNKPIRLVVGYTAGGVTDILARVLAQAMGKHLGQPVVVENKPGASAMIGADSVAKSAPDGYTIFLSSGAPISINIQMVAKPLYDPIKDFTHIGQVTTNDMVLVVNNAFPARTLPEFVDLVKKNPGKYSFGSGGLGLPTHLAGELLKQAAGLDLVHVPYKGDAPAVTDLLGGNIPAMVAGLGSVAAQIKAGQLRPIAVFGKERVPSANTIPTVSEMGYPGFHASLWGGISGPAGLPPEIVARLSSALRLALQEPDLKSRFADLGLGTAYSSSEEFTAYLKDDAAKWGAIINRLGLKQPG